MDSWNQSTHARSGLIDKVKASTLDEAEVEARMLEFLREHVPPKISPMCGNTICQDRRFLARWMPALEDYFHYRNLDVSTLKELVQALAARCREGLGQAGQARGARRHLRIDRRAEVLSRALLKLRVVKFCSHCGSPRSSFGCPKATRCRASSAPQCGTIHYQNPKIVVGCLPVWEGSVLLCKRAIEPRLGLWTLPAGFLENGETLAAGALRETLEEANARVEIDDLYTVISLPHISQVYVMFRARLDGSRLRPGDREPRGRAVSRGGHSVGSDRVSHDHAHAAQLLPRSQARRISGARERDRSTHPGQTRTHGRGVGSGGTKGGIKLHSVRPSVRQTTGRGLPFPCRRKK